VGAGSAARAAGAGLNRTPTACAAPPPAARREPAHDTTIEDFRTMTPKFTRALAAAAATLLLASAHAETTVADAWVRGTVPQQQATGLFATVTSSTGGRLVAVRTPVAGVAEIHEMKMDGNTMKMRALADGLALPAGQPVKLAPGGYHVMLMGLKQALKAGDVVPVTLVVEDKDGRREEVELQAPVRALGAMPAHGHGMKGMN
jgi:copper(I)-binding protein